MTRAIPADWTIAEGSGTDADSEIYLIAVFPCPVSDTSFVIVIHRRKDMVTGNKEEWSQRGSPVRCCFVLVCIVVAVQNPTAVSFVFSATQRGERGGGGRGGEQHP